MNKTDKIYVAGHKGLVGSAIVRKLEKEGYQNLIVKSREELDLLSQQAVDEFFAKEKPEYVFLAAAKAGGILANNTQPADFIYQNLTIQTNVIQAAHQSAVKKLLFLGSSCVYPREAKQPIKEGYLLTGELEPTNKAYAAAKIAGIIMCQSYNEQYGTNFISVMPTNTYGPGDNFDPESSHAIPGIIQKIHEAKSKNETEVELWGTGRPKREFIYVDDLAEACVFLMSRYNDQEIINIGIGEDITVAELAELIKQTVGFDGKITWDESKPDGMERKLLDVSKLKELGWSPKTELAEGLKKTYQWYQQTHEF